jgi:hypothetical protein
MSKPGLYANINAKRKRIAAGSGEKMRKPGVPALLQPKISKNQPRLLSLPKKERNNAFGKVGKQASVPKKRKSRNSGWKAAKAGGRHRVQCQTSGPKT